MLKDYSNYKYDAPKRLFWGIFKKEMNMKINEFVVVEGRDDTVNVKRAVDCDTIETNGSAISKETLEVIRQAHENVVSLY